MIISFLRSHPYIIAGILIFLLLFSIGIFALDLTLGESLLLGGVISVIGAGGIWWKEVGLG